jgi:hypothetical protein
MVVMMRIVDVLLLLLHIASMYNRRIDWRLPTNNVTIHPDDLDEVEI